MDAEQEIPEVSTRQAKELLDGGGAVFVDVRDPNSYEQAHIPGASHLNDHNIQEFVESADRAKTVVVYCYHGNSSLGGAAFLREQGFEDVYSMSGGFEEWRQTFEMEKGSPG